MGGWGGMGGFQGNCSSKVQQGTFLDLPNDHNPSGNCPPPPLYYEIFQIYRKLRELYREQCYLLSSFLS